MPNIQDFINAHDTLLRQGKEIKSRGGNVAYCTQKLLKVMPFLKYRMDVVNAFMLEIGYSSVDLGKMIAKVMAVDKPLKVLKILQASGMMPNQIQACLNAAGGTYATYATKAIDNIVPQSVINLASVALNPVESQLRSSVQVGVSILSATGEAMEKLGDTLKDVGEAITDPDNWNPANWF